jgi:hypothetical protein
MVEIARVICGFRPVVLQEIGSYKSPFAPPYEKVSIIPRLI